MTLQGAAAGLPLGRGRFQKLFQESPLPMLVIHARTLRFLAVNKAASRLYGYSQAEFRDLSLAAIHRGRQTTLPLSVFRRSSTTDISGLGHHKRKDGSLLDVELFAHRILMLEVPAWLVVIQDTTARREAEQLQLRALAAEKTARLKDLMVHTVSHELRTPLTGLRGILSTVIEYWDQLVPGEIKQMIVAADKSAQVLESMLADILTLSSAESAALSLNPVPVDLPSLLKRVIADQQRPGQAPEYRLFAPASGEIQADMKGLELIINNVLQNAQKYSPPDSPIHLSVDFEGDYAAISIRDFGPGVPSEELELIFESFYRTVHAEASSAGGTGLGLAIARAMTVAHGGSIRAANAGDGGLVVTIKLPRVPTPP